MVNDSLPFTIKTGWLLRIYFIVPILFLLLVIDVVWFNQRLFYPHMGLESLLLPWYLLIFELPHVIGSLLGFADKEYLHHYKSKLLIGLPLVLGVVGGLVFIDLVLALVAYLVATMYHVMKQQMGVGLILGVTRGVWFTVWSWSAIVMTSVLLIFFTLPERFPAETLPSVNIFIFTLLLTFVASGLIVCLQSTSRVAKWYAVLSTVSLIVGYVFFVTHYLFFGFFLFRFIHDVTAFYFYIAHETNRNHQTVHNFLYQLLRHIPLPLFILVPLLSIGLAYIIRAGMTSESVVYVVVIIFGFTHYYLESLIWKRDALHRQSIKVEK